MKTDCVIADFESVQGQASGNSWIHSIVLLAVTFQSGKVTCSTIRKGICIKINNVINNPIVEVLIESDYQKRKHGEDVSTCSKYNIPLTHHVDFSEAVKLMIDFVIENGGKLISHNLLSDLQFLSSTQELVRESGDVRVMKQRMAEFPDTGMYDKRWSSIIKVCSMSLLCNRCPKFIKGYKNWSRENKKNITKGGYYSSRLQDFVQYVKNDSVYTQKHAAAQDTIDLFTVLKQAVKADGNIFDGYSYMPTPVWPRPT